MAEEAAADGDEGEVASDAAPARTAAATGAHLHGQHAHSERHGCCSSNGLKSHQVSIFLSMVFLSGATKKLRER